MSFDEIFDLTAGVYFNFYNILEPGIGQFREFEPGRVHTIYRINSLGLFLGDNVHKFTCGKREESVS